MSDETPDSLIPYDEIVQEALRAVVGRVLGEIQSTGGELPGIHHFYITFKTGAAGVSIPPHLRERFPDEMTIVLQNKFWDLEVGEEGFSVGLSFNKVPAKLSIPFAAITAFVAEAIDVEDAGIEVGPAPEPERVAELEERLAADAALRKAFEALTPGRQREYNLHISDAKQAETRNRRIDKVIPRILDGRGLRDR